MAEGELGCFSWGILLRSVRCQEALVGHLIIPVVYIPSMNKQYSNQILNYLEHFSFASTNMEPQHKMVLISLSSSNPYRSPRLCSASTQWQKRMDACRFFPMSSSS
ncbi:hypothetical protein T03_13594 [Trichinella britovi]|uniref:Uncharacterized protein n=1 Tax=Trichinella britovi TaxID=45882 RepID=A0A0V1CGU2_TRIBR|nr:hypothetical protein T03_13594 [Trichinella britovi]